MGRLRLTGCWRSSTTSLASLTRYTPDAARQNATNASPTLIHTEACTRSALASGAATTSTFFTHWRGRAALSSPDPVPTRPPAPAAGAPAGTVPGRTAGSDPAGIGLWESAGMAVEASAWLCDGTVSPEGTVSFEGTVPDESVAVMRSSPAGRRGGDRRGRRPWRRAPRARSRPG